MSSGEEAAQAEEAADDNAVIAPAPSAEVFRPHYRAAPVRRKRDPLFMRQTLIPILLTTGVLMPVIAVMVLISDADSAVVDIVPKWAAILLIIGGLVSLGFGILNMATVKATLEKSAQGENAPTA